MGQRHQIYVKIPPLEYGEEKGKRRVIGIHHQWLYGRRAIRSLQNFLVFHENSKDGNYNWMNSYTDPATTLGKCYGFDHEEGYEHNTHILEHKETENPFFGDNNDGITIVDASGEKPKYCFMALQDFECVHKSMASSYRKLEPYGVEEYINFHYPNWSKMKPEDESDKKFLDGIKKAVDYISKYETLTIDECIEIFPEMYKEAFKKQFQDEWSNTTVGKLVKDAVTAKFAESKTKHDQKSKV